MVGPEGWRGTLATVEGFRRGIRRDKWDEVWKQCAM